MEVARGRSVQGNSGASTNSQKVTGVRRASWAFAHMGEDCQRRSANGKDVAWGGRMGLVRFWSLLLDSYGTTTAVSLEGLGSVMATHGRAG